MATDSSGNIFLAGNFAESASFASISLDSAGAADFFVAKYDPDGTLLWGERRFRAAKLAGLSRAFVS